jgi:hypothetical protein
VQERYPYYGTWCGYTNSYKQYSQRVSLKNLMSLKINY